MSAGGGAAAIPDTGAGATSDRRSGGRRRRPARRGRPGEPERRRRHRRERGRDGHCRQRRSIDHLRRRPQWRLRRSKRQRERRSRGQRRRCGRRSGAAAEAHPPPRGRFYGDDLRPPIRRKKAGGRSCPHISTASSRSTIKRRAAPASKPSTPGAGRNIVSALHTGDYVMAAFGAI